MSGWEGNVSLQSHLFRQPVWLLLPVQEGLVWRRGKLSGGETTPESKWKVSRITLLAKI